MKSNTAKKQNYTAEDIEVLEGLEPVRRRPGMYIGGTDNKSMHHLFAEVIDNSMDEAVAGHANRIEVTMHEDGAITVTDNGRGIPVDPHPKFKDKSALEIIMTTLHAGGKFDGKAYDTSGGLHGVGVSVVNALCDELTVEVARDSNLYTQSFKQGHATSKLQNTGKVSNRRGTKIRFHPDPEIFKNNTFDPDLIFRMARSKAYLFGGVEIRWNCEVDNPKTPKEATFHFPNGLQDFLGHKLGNQKQVTEMFVGKNNKQGHGAVEWAVTWYADDGFVNSYCNTVPTKQGGTHEAGLRITLTKSLKAYAELTGNKKGNIITTDDVMTSAAALLSVFIREPEFVGQTKDRLATVEAQKIVDNAIRDSFDHWLAASPTQATNLLNWVIDRADERLKRRKEKDVARKSAINKLRLPGKLADCARGAKDTELFIVEGDSAGGSAKQARDRNSQAILPLRGKILNVASASSDKLFASQQIADLIQALGCGTRDKCSVEDLRYDRIIIMTDADVDGAHIASLLITFFFQEMPQIIQNGHLFLAVPPLFKISQGGKILYARDEQHKDLIVEAEFDKNKKIEIARFKGLGEMMPKQLKETTMDKKNRTLLKVEIEEEKNTKKIVDSLMGNKPEKRFNFIRMNAEFTQNELLDV